MENGLLCALIKKFRNQDMSAFAMIYDEFKKLIYHYSGKLQDDDAVQELTLYLIELLYNIPLNKFSNPKENGMKRYIAVALKNKYLAISDKNRKYIKFCDELELVPDYDDVLDNISVKEALKCLSPKQRMVIIYKYIYCLPDSEIAQMVGISRQAVNGLKNRGLIMLKEFYSQT